MESSRCSCAAVGLSRVQRWGDARVSAAAAQYIAWMGYTRYLPDVNAAAVSEQDAQAKELIEKACQQLEQQVVVPLE